MNKASAPPPAGGGQIPPGLPGIPGMNPGQQIKIATRTVPISTGGHGDMVNLTPDASRLLNNVGMTEGMVCLFVPGSTASLTTIEFEDGLKHDFPAAMQRLAPDNVEYEHDKAWHDGNGHSHVRASTVGPSLTIPFSDRRLMLGTWQQIVLVDWDNRHRTRDVILQFWGV